MIRLFEFEDAEWLPSAVRDGGLDFLRHIIGATKFYECTAPILSRAIAETGSSSIVDLCSGGGGPIEQLRVQVSADVGRDLNVTLTDRFPNLPAFRWLEQRNKGHLSFRAVSTDAARVPADLAGFRTMFSAAHHFEPDALREVLRDAVKAGRGIALFDASEKGIRPFLGIPVILVMHPILYVLGTPFIRPFKWSRLFLTYLVPVIPIYTMWDGIASGFRTYQPDELLAIAHSVGANDYQWTAGKLKNRIGANVAYLVGTR